MSFYPVFHPGKLLKVRLARPEELELYAGEDTESSTGADDDDDSNREDNWRNDYPEEESDVGFSFFFRCTCSFLAKSLGSLYKCFVFRTVRIQILITLPSIAADRNILEI